MRDLARDFRILDAMSDEERRHPERVGAAARRRIAALAGTELAPVDHLLGLFAAARAPAKEDAAWGPWQAIKCALGFASKS